MDKGRFKHFHFKKIILEDPQKLAARVGQISKIFFFPLESIIIAKTLGDITVYRSETQGQYKPWKKELFPWFKFFSYDLRL